MKDKNQIKVIIFDVGGVLSLGTGKTVHDYMKKKFKLDSDAWDNAIDAAKRYNELAKEYHGEFAYINAIPNESDN